MARGPLRGMFAAVPRRYDLMNRILTLGLDQVWRRQAAAEVLAGFPARIVDLCTGTGDLAVLLRRLAPADTQVTGVDFVRPMLDAAARKVSGIRWLLADAGDLPLRDGSVDCVGIAFGFRNLVYRNPRRDAHLSELRRVVAPGGRFVVVETSQPDRGAWRSLVHSYHRAITGPVGGSLSGNGPAYRYLAASARLFHGPAEVERMLAAAGFSSVSTRPLLGGAACIHVARA
jgi:demethylmenaquinone methyltransferase/2-methoxy-6-polyprenyl-1,4-benzoquinol methylase